MSTYAPGVVVKEEVLEPEVQADAQQFDDDASVNCSTENVVKSEGELADEGGEIGKRTRRSSRRLHYLEKGGSEVAAKFLKCVREELEEDRRLKRRQKYERKKQRLARMPEEERAIRRERARMLALARNRELRKAEKEGGVPKSKPRKNGIPSSTRGQTVKALSAEERERRRERDKFYAFVKRAELTDEAREQLRMKAYLQRQAWRASKTKEELEEMNKKRAESCRRRREEDENYRKHCIERSRKWKQNLIEEKFERYMGSVKKAVSKYLKNLKVKNPEKYHQNYEKAKQRLRQKTANETLEQRQKRLLRYKISAGKQKLKRQLEGDGVTPEVISKRMEELEENMRKQPQPPPSQYKPRPRKDNYSNKSENIPKRAVEAVAIEDVGRSCDSNSVDATRSDSYNYHFVPCTSSLAEGHENAEEIYQIDSTPITNIPLLMSVVSLSSSSVATSHLVLEERLPLQATPEFVPVTLYTRENNENFQESARHFTIQHDFSPPSSPIVAEADIPKQKSSDKGDLDFQEKIALPPQLPIPPTPTGFKCPQCPHVLSSDDELRGHLGTSHSLTCWKCPKCQEVMLSPAELSQHFKSHMVSSSEPQKPKVEAVRECLGSKPVSRTGNFICIKCRFPSTSCSSPVRSNMFETLQGLMQHVRKQHPRSYWPCQNCKVLKYSKDRLQFHQKNCLMSSRSVRFQKTRRKPCNNDSSRRKK